MKSLLLLLSFSLAISNRQTIIDRVLPMMNIKQSFHQPYGPGVQIIAEFPSWTSVFNNSYRLDIQLTISDRMIIDPKSFKFCILTVAIEHNLVPGLQVYPMKAQTWKYSAQWLWQWPKTKIYFTYMYSPELFRYLNGNGTSQPFAEHVNLHSYITVELHVKFGLVNSSFW